MRETCFMSVIVDDANLSKTGQPSVCIKYRAGLDIKEHFISFTDRSNSHVAAGIVGSIKEALQSRYLHDILIVVQSYKRTSVKAGHLSGVQQQIREEHPYCLCSLYVTHVKSHYLIVMFKSQMTESPLIKALSEQGDVRL